MKPIHMAGPWITEHEIKVVEDCMRNGWYDYGYVERFQKEFAVYGRAVADLAAEPRPDDQGLRACLAFGAKHGLHGRLDQTRSP